MDKGGNDVVVPGLGSDIIAWGDNIGDGTVALLDGVV
jgi:hypothetical protein